MLTTVKLVSNKQTFGTESPSTVTVEHSDDHRHVGTSDGGGRMGAKEKGRERGIAKIAQPGHRIRSCHEASKGSNVGQRQTCIDLISARKEQRLRVQQALKKD